MRAFRKTIKQKHLYKEYLNIINGILGLSGKEAEVFSLLIQLELEQKPVLGNKVDILSTTNRKAIMAETLINKNNLSKYISILKSKGLINKDKDGYFVNKMFIPEVDKNTIETLFVLEIEQTEDERKN